MEQVHGAEFKSINPSRMEAGRILTIKGVDGVVLEGSGPVAMGVRVADCMPVFAVSEGKLIGAFHAGRRGVEAGIGESFLRRACGELVKKDSIEFFAGPHICGRCYEISAADAETFPSEALNGRRLDLFKALQIRLIRAGIKKEKVKLLKKRNYCTFENEKYSSYRRKDKKRSMAFAIQG